VETRGELKSFQRNKGKNEIVKDFNESGIHGDRKQKPTSQHPCVLYTKLYFSNNSSSDSSSFCGERGNPSSMFVILPSLQTLTLAW